jgi:hypothetical protein
MPISEVQQIFYQLCKSGGFIKRSSTWFRRSPETTIGLNLQKSQYEPKYFLNIGIWINELHAEQLRGIETADIVARDGDVAPDAEAELRWLLDSRSDLLGGERAEKLSEYFRDALLPALQLFASVDSLRSPAGKELLQNLLVSGPAQSLISQQRP